MPKSKREQDQERRKKGLEPESSVDLKVSDNPEVDVPELMERVQKGEAFIFGGYNFLEEVYIKEKEEDLILEQVYEKLLEVRKKKGDLSSPKMHIISSDFGIMKIIE